jgi:hypothetical protein
MADHTKHTFNLGSSFVLNNLIYLAETQRCEGVFLTFAFVNRTFNQFNLNLAHVCKDGLQCLEAARR